eukprot:SAG31_NODE_918_length_11020_cov_14.801392_13_plen_148_part_00
MDPIIFYKKKSGSGKRLRIDSVAVLSTRLLLPEKKVHQICCKKQTASAYVPRYPRYRGTAVYTLGLVIGRSGRIYSIQVHSTCTHVYTHVHMSRLAALSKFTMELGRRNCISARARCGGARGGRTASRYIDDGARAALPVHAYLARS